MEVHVSKPWRQAIDTVGSAGVRLGVVLLLACPFAPPTYSLGARRNPYPDRTARLGLDLEEKFQQEEFHSPPGDEPDRFHCVADLDCHQPGEPTFQRLPNPLGNRFAFRKRRLVLTRLTPGPAIPAFLLPSHPGLRNKFTSLRCGQYRGDHAELADDRVDRQTVL